jgi:uncharacterized protein (UPF0335 family)
VSIGHNEAGALKAFVERVEKLEAERSDIAEDIKSVYAEAKSTGFDAKILRKVIAKRRRDQAEVQEEEALLVAYWSALYPEFG